MIKRIKQTLCCAVLVSGFVSHLSSLCAAEPWPMNQRAITIPINIDPARRQDIKQLILCASADQGRTWPEVAVATPEKTSFTFNAMMDGLYWFHLIVVDNQGNRDPADLARTPPAQKILIDTLKPVLRIVSADRQGEDIVVNWEIQEEHPDLATLKLEYRPADAAPNQWYTAMLNPALTGQARFRVNGGNAVTVRMQVQDVATNATTASAEVPAAAPQQNHLVSSSGAAPAPANPWENRPTSPAPPPPAQPAFPPSNGPDSKLVAASDPAVTALPNNGIPSGARLGRGPMPPLQLVNNAQLTLDYELAKVGPSGLGKVELWMTQDDGRSWRKFAEDSDLKPPLTVDLPGEGIYGFCLVVQSKAGLGKRGPTPGDAPEMRIEVDTTTPAARLYAPEPDAKRANSLVISWTATDRNLTANPITLQWAEKLGGMWETIGADLPNSGRYTWQLPSTLPYKVYLRLIARDLAGNACVAETPEPVLVDLNEPEAKILGVANIRKP